MCATSKVEIGARHGELWGYPKRVAWGGHTKFQRIGSSRNWVLKNGILYKKNNIPASTSRAMQTLGPAWTIAQTPWPQVNACRLVKAQAKAILMEMKKMRPAWSWCEHSAHICSKILRGKAARLIHGRCPNPVNQSSQTFSNIFQLYSLWFGYQPGLNMGRRYIAIYEP